MAETTGNKMPLITADLEDQGGYRQRYGSRILGISQPRDIDELRALVLEANRGNFVLHVHGFGLAGEHRLDNVVVVDLGNMNRIIEVNTRGAYALVEPGVTYQQLYHYLQENETGLWIDCDRNNMNAVASSIAAHEFGYTAYGDHMMMQCGTEVMLGNGELVRLGMGALPGSNTWQLAKYAYGPYVDGLFTQSNLGIVTKVGTWLMPAPPAYRPFMLSLDKHEDIAAAVEILRDLKINVIIPNPVVISKALLDAAPFARRADYQSGDAVDVDKIRDSFKLGAWNLYAALYNTPDNVELLWPMVSEALGSIEGAVLYTTGEREDDPVWKSREGLMRGIPAQDFARLNHWSGQYRCEIGMACPPSGEDVLRLDALVTKILATYAIDDLSECVAGWRSITRRNYFLFDDDTVGNTRACVNEIIGKAAEQGFGLTHRYTDHAGIQVQHRQNEGFTKLQQNLKKALDPQGVLL